MGLTKVDGSTFEREVMTNSLPVVVDFSANWCGPCKAMAPTVSALARAMADEVRFVEVNIDQSPELARRFDVQSIPTFIRFDGGAVSRVVVGARSTAGLTKDLALASGPTESEGERPRSHRWWARKGAVRQVDQGQG